jgi:hypothetical protein
MTDDFMTDQTRRDRWGRYLVVPPDATKPTGYTRATTIAKTLDDTTALMAWGERMTAIGLARRPDILAQIDDNTDDTKLLNALCQKAKEAGGATIRRDLGTALHAILEKSWTDPDYTPPAAHVNDVKAVHDTLRAHGLSVVDGMTERVVVLDEHRIAGTFDLIVRNQSGDLFLADIKTGSTVKYGGLSFATQLTIYAWADALYTQGAAADGSEDVRTEMPPVSRSVAYLIHVEPGSGRCDLHQLNLDRSLLSMALAVRDMRKSSDYLTAVDTPTDDDRDRWIRDRLTTLRQTAPELLIRAWPADIPTPKNHPEPYDTPTINRLVALCDRLETETESPFPPTDPATVVQPEATQAPVTATDAPGIDEGPEMPDQLDDVRTQFETLTDEQRLWITDRVREAREAHMPIRVAESPTQRRIMIARAMIHAVTHDLDTAEQRVRDVLHFMTDDDMCLLTTVPVGAIIGTLNAEQAGIFESWMSMAAHNPDRAPNGA